MRIESRHYIAIFVISLVAIAMQILISRIMSVTLYYHFAFVGITVAMLGLTAGALKVYLDPARFSAARADYALTEYAVRFALSLTMAVVMYVPLFGMVLHLPHWIGLHRMPVAILALGLLLGSFVLLLAAFVQCGVCIAVLLTRFPAQAARLYAFDLCGAAAGCIVVIMALKWLDPISTVLLLALALVAVAWRLLPQDAEKGLRLHVRWASLLLLGLCLAQAVGSVIGDPPLRLSWAKDGLIPIPEFERWNTYSRVAVLDNDLRPFGWGFGHSHDQESIKQKYLDIDAQAGTIITHFDGDLKKIGYLKDDIINLGYQVRPVHSVAVIGVGGGRDLLSGLVFGASHIQGIELNPAIFEVLTRAYGDFSGHLDRRPEVSLANAEARSYLVSHPERYDMIQISLIDTWAATAAGGLTLSENKLYTTDAWEDFLSRLTDNGLLSVSRWYDAKANPGEFYRMLSIAAAAIKARDPGSAPRAHILAANVNRIVTFILSKSPLSSAEVAHFEAACAAHGFTVLLTPDAALDATAARLAAGADDAFYDSLPQDVTPTTDDRPFFFNMVRPTSFLFKGKTDMRTDSSVPGNNVAVVLLLGLCGFTLVAGGILIGRPLLGIYWSHRIRLSEAGASMAYFAAIGLGFMLIEVSQMQRLMIFLGHPVYGLSVVLFTLLLASGLGSWFQQRFFADKALWLPPTLLLVILLAIGLLTPSITAHLKYYDTLVRIIASALLLLPMGLFMGMMFPVGVTLTAWRYPSLLPWFWGINGAASVFASVFAVVLSLQVGISATFWAGVACYVVCPLVTARKKPIMADALSQQV